MRTLLTLLFMAMPALLFFLPLAIRKGKWLAIYLVAASATIVALWTEHLYRSHGATGYPDAGESFGVIVLILFTVLHIAGAVVRAAIISFQDSRASSGSSS